MLTQTQAPADPRPAGPVAPAPPRRRRLLQDANTMALAALVFGVWALAASMFAVALAAQAAGDADRAGNAAAVAPAAAPAAGTTAVTLKEFAITPATLTVGAGATLRVENAGAITHNLVIDGKGKATPMLDKGASADLVLAGLAPGTHAFRCDVPGHEAAGMKGSLTVQ